MANVLSVLHMASDDDIRNQAATMEVVTIGTILRIQGGKTVDSAAGVLNSIGKFFGSKDKLVKVKKTKSLENELQERILALKYTSRPDLDILLRKKLAERLSLRNPSDELLSKTLVNKAAKHMDIAEELTPAEKIDAVFQRYMERLLAKFQETFNKADVATKAKFRESIQDSIDSMTDEQRQQVREAMKTDEVTADTVMKMLKTTGTTGLVGVLGSTFGSYILLSVIIHGFFTTLLGITVPFAVYTGAASTLSIITGPVGWTALAMFGIWQYVSGSSKVDGEVYCQLIFTAGLLQSKKFAPDEEDLPDWLVPKDQRRKTDIEQSDASYSECEQELFQTKQALKEAETKCKRAEQHERVMRDNLYKEQARVEDAKKKIQGYENEHAGLEQHINNLNEQLKKASQAEENSTSSINSLKDQIKQTKAQMAKMQKDHKKNIEIVKNSPKKEQEISELIQQATQESEQETVATGEAQAEFTKKRLACNQERDKRIQNFQDKINAWIKNDYPHVTCQLDEDIISQLAMSNNELQKAVVLVIKQILDSDTPGDLGETYNSNELKLPIQGMRQYLIYTVERSSDTIHLMKFTDSKTLNELEQERKENENLKHRLDMMREDQDEYIRQLEALNNSNRPLENAEIRNNFMSALNEAKIELDIFSPWMNAYVCDKKFMEKISRLLDQGVKVKIRYGIANDNSANRNGQNNRSDTTEKIARQLHENFGDKEGFSLYRDNSHAKLFICDDKYYVLSSFNVLSFKGAYEKNPELRREIGEYSSNQKNLMLYRKKYFNFNGVESNI